MRSLAVRLFPSRDPGFEQYLRRNRVKMVAGSVPLCTTIVRNFVRYLLTLCPPDGSTVWHPRAASRHRRPTRSCTLAPASGSGGLWELQASQQA